MYRFHMLSLVLALSLLAGCGGGGGGTAGADGAAGYEYDASSGANRDLAGIPRAVPPTMGALEAI